MSVKHLADMIDLVKSRIKKREGWPKPELSNYELAKRLSRIGVEITQNGLNGYYEDSAMSMRWDVMAGLAELGPLSDKEVMEYVRRSRYKR